MTRYHLRTPVDASSNRGVFQMRRVNPRAPSSPAASLSYH